MLCVFGSDIIKGAFSVKQKRSFHSILSGLKFTKYGQGSIRFLTLTTSSLCSCQSGYDVSGSSLNKDFDVFKKRIKRYSPYRLYSEGYISKRKLISVYGRDSSVWFTNFGFEYFKVTTNEGNGVIHILYRGSYLPYTWIVDNWQDIHLSWEVNIQSVDLADPKGSAFYVVGQYVSGQGSSYVRGSHSWNWCFRGFKSMWYRLKRFYPECALACWDKCLRRCASDYFFPQSSLWDFG